MGIVKGGETALTGQVWHGADTNSPLSAKGAEAVATLQSKVSAWGITAAYSSPQPRIIESAKIALQGSGVTAETREELGPRKITPFEKMSGDEVKALYKQHHNLSSEKKITSDEVFAEVWGPWEEGAFEINELLRKRILNFVHIALTEHPGEKIFVQTHVDWIREIYRYYTDAFFTEDYTVSAKTVLKLIFNTDNELVSIEREGMPNR